MITDILLQLEQKLEKLQGRHLFSEGPAPEEIERFEYKMDLALPPELKAFFAVFNGGCLPLGSWDDEFWNDAQGRQSIIWNSNYFLSLSEIMDTYRQEGPYAQGDMMQFERDTGRRLIPIIHTNGQELLVWDASDNSKTPIYDAFHELHAEEWAMVYPSFADLLKEYVERNGDIETIGR